MYYDLDLNIRIGYFNRTDLLSIVLQTMRCVMCSFLCPQPLQDVLVHGELGGYYSSKASTKSHFPGAGLVVKLSDDEAEKHGAFAASILARIILAAIGAFALVGAATPAIACAIGAVVSIPATLIAAGSFGVYWGVATIVASASTGSFATLGTGLLALAGGWIAIQKYMILPIGIAELALPKKPI